MDAIEVLKNAAELAFADLMESIDGLDETAAWACVKPLEGEYLHTAGSIVAIVQHVACGKFGYAASAFTDCSPRGRDVFARTKEIGSRWEETKKLLVESHSFWMQSWSGLTPDDLDKEFRTLMGKPKSAWKIISTVIGHDYYHGGQIHLIRTTLPPTNIPPDMNFDEEEKAWREIVCW